MKKTMRTRAHSTNYWTWSFKLKTLQQETFIIPPSMKVMTLVINILRCSNKDFEENNQVEASIKYLI